MKKTFPVMLAGWMIIPLMLSCTTNLPDVNKEASTNFKIERPVFPDRDFLITDYGAVNDGIVLNTESINDAIRACSESGGGRVIIPEGVWVTGSIQLMDNVNLLADEGAVILFSSNFDDYPFVKTYFEGRRDLRAMPLLFGDSLVNIAITGKGIFDGSGDAWRPVKKMKMTEDQWEELVGSGGVLSESGDIWWPNEYAYEASIDPGKFSDRTPDDPEMKKYKAFFRPPLVQLINCDRVLLEGPLFENSPGWCIHPLMCTNLTVNDITVRNPWYAQNGDGIDVESCKYVSIKNSNFDVGDDAICIKSGKDREGRERGKPTQFVEVDNCIVHHGHGGFVVGSEMSGGVKDIWVQNCSFTGTDVGLRFKSTRGRGGVVENIHIDNIRMINIARDAIIFNLFYAGLAPTEMGEDPIENLVIHAPEVSEETPEFRNISISNVNCQGAMRAVQVMGLPEMPVTGLSIENSVFTAEMGINCLFADSINLKNVVVNTKGFPAINLINVGGAEITSCESNNETLLQVDGAGSREIAIYSYDRDETMNRTRMGEKSGEDIVTFRMVE